MRAGSLRWAIVVVDPDPTVGHEQRGARRCLVVSNEPFHLTGRATVCPITAARAEPRYPNEVAIPADLAGQTSDGVVLVHQVRTVSLERVRSRVVGTVDDASIRIAIRRALAHHFWLDRRDEDDLGVA